MKLSIITACYNSEASIEETIKSLASQELEAGTKVEYIIIDGKSTDNTLEIAHKYKNNISVLISERDSGIYNALNKGIQKASGDVIGFLHSDDTFYSKDVLQTIADAFYANDCDAVYGDGIYVSSDNPNRIVRNWISGKFSRTSLQRGWMPFHPALFIKRDLYLKHGLFNETYRISSDYDLVLRFLYKHNVNAFYINKHFIKMKLGGASSSIKNLKKKWKEDYTIMKSHGLNPYWTLAYKNLSKLKQFFSR